MSPTGDLTTAIGRIERRVISWAVGLERMWGDRSEATRRLGTNSFY
jgi:hypothetical protein